MPSRDIESCDSRLKLVWLTARDEWKIKYPDTTPFLTCTSRSPEEQDALYEQGRTTPGNIVTNARRFESAHNFSPSQAFDIGFKNADGTLDWDINLFRAFASIVSKLDSSIVWGGNWKSLKDYPHFETADWKSLKDSLSSET